MKSWLLYIPLILFLIAAPNSNAQNQMTLVREQFKSHQYDEVIRIGEAIRPQSFGKNCEIDYMLGTSYCRSKDYHSGLSYLSWCLSYPVSDRFREIIHHEIQVCENAWLRNQLMEAPVSETDVRVISSTAGVRSRGKMYHFLEKDQAVYNTPVEWVDTIPLEIIEQRLFSPDTDSVTIVSILSGITRNRFDIHVRDKYIIVNANPAADIDRIFTVLSVYETFYKRNFNIELPPEYLTVYITHDIDELFDLSRRLHGLKLPRASIGYSFQDDLSMLVKSSTRYSSTMFHELFHLMAHASYGDIPPWLDEGVASLYEVSGIIGDSVAGQDNWRGNLLREVYDGHPKVSELITMDWQQFDAEDDDEALIQAKNHAVARYFAKYLQDKGMLPVVFKKLQKLTPSGYPEGKNEAIKNVLEECLQEPLEETDDHFNHWLMTEVIMR